MRLLCVRITKRLFTSKLCMPFDSTARICILICILIPEMGLQPKKNVLRKFLGKYLQIRGGDFASVYFLRLSEH